MRARSYQQAHPTQAALVPAAAVAPCRPRPTRQRPRIARTRLIDAKRAVQSAMEAGREVAGVPVRTLRTRLRDQIRLLPEIVAVRTTRRRIVPRGAGVVTIAYHLTTVTGALENTRVRTQLPMSVIRRGACRYHHLEWRVGKEGIVLIVVVVVVDHTLHQGVGRLVEAIPLRDKVMVMVNAKNQHALHHTIMLNRLIIKAIGQRRRDHKAM